MKWYAGSDHAGLELKRELVAHLESKGFEVEDLGTHGPESVDYPDYGRAVAEAVVEKGGQGLLVCSTGNGIMIAANKVKGARAAMVTNTFTAEMARAHNNANVICFGARVTGAGVALRALDAFCATEFEGGRHQRRVDKLAAIEE